MLNKVYVIPSYKCNLNCPHCDIHNFKDNFNEDNFFNTLNNTEAKEFILFGGEPLLNKSLFHKCLETNKITSISTNLLLLDRDSLNAFKEHNLSISTSWNPFRFNDIEYRLWLHNLKLIKTNGLTCIVLITLTQDLFDYDHQQLLQIFQQIDDTNAVDGIKFEHLVDDNLDKDFHKKADEWLCQWFNNWDFHMENMIEKQVKNWCFDCSQIYTLKPNGDLTKGCPQYSKAIICEECLGCNLAKICRPCSLQKTCSFPKHLYELINTNMNME